MGDGAGIHRDIYVGMVAEELAKQGYYDTVKEVYAFVSKTAEKEEMHFYEDELRCALASLQCLRNGEHISKYMMQTVRCGAETEAELQLEKEKEQLRQSLQTGIGNTVLYRYAKPDASTKETLTIKATETLWSGFCYGEPRKSYVNAYLPNVLNKWIELTAQDESVGNIVTKTYRTNEKPTYIIKEEMQTYVLEEK